MELLVVVLRTHSGGETAAGLVADALEPRIISRGMLTDERAESGDGPVLIVAGEPVGPADLDAGCVLSPIGLSGATAREYEEDRIEFGRALRQFLVRTRASGYREDPFWRARWPWAKRRET